MNEPHDPPVDPRDELASLAASARALLEQYEASGADALACDPAAAAAFLAGAALPAPRGEAARPAFRPPAEAPPRAAPAPPRDVPKPPAPAEPATEPRRAPT